MKGITSRGLIKYYKYAPTGEIATTPIFPTDISASMGIDGITITPSSYYYLTSLSTHAPARGFTCTFDIGPHKNGIYSIAYNGIVSGGNYPALVLLNVRCSEDGNNWTTIAASYGGRSTTIDTPLIIPTPNNYRYLRFDTTNDDTRHSGSGVNSMRLTYGETDLVPSGRSDHDTYSSTDKKKYVFAKFLREDYYQYWKRNVTVVGNPTISNNVISNFSNSNYLNLPEAYYPGGAPWEMVGCFNIPDIPQYHPNLCLFGSSDADIKTPLLLVNADRKFILYLTSNGSSWDISSNTISANGISVGEQYIRIKFTGSSYIISSKVANDWVDYITINSSIPIYQGNIPVCIGSASSTHRDEYLLGSIDLVKSHIKINDKLWWQGTSRSTLAESNFVLPGTSDNYDYKEKVYKKYMPKRNKLKRP